MSLRPGSVERHVTKLPDVPLASGDALVAALVDASVSPATRRAYAADWDRFNAWCIPHGIDALVPGEDAVATYVAEASVTIDGVGDWVVASSTLQRWVSGINQVHAAVGGAVPGRSELVRRTLAGVRRTRATPARRRRPLRVKELRAIVNQARLDASGWTDEIRAVRDAFILLAGYFGAFRSAELVALTVADVTFENDGLRVAVRRSKTDQLAVGTTKGLPRTTAPGLCPVCAWVRWRDLIDAHDAGGRPVLIAHLELGWDEQEHLCQERSAPPVRSDRAVLIRRLGSAGWIGSEGVAANAVNYVVRQRAAAAGLSAAVVERLGAHSLRAGFVTDAYAAGASDGEVMRQTGHRSITQVRAYQRDAPMVGNAVTRLDPDRP